MHMDMDMGMHMDMDMDMGMDMHRDMHMHMRMRMHMHMDVHMLDWHLASPPRGVEGLERDGVDEERARERRVEALNQRDHRRLSRSGRAAQGGDGTRLDGEGDPIEDKDLGARRVGEAHLQHAVTARGTAGASG